MAASRPSVSAPGAQFTTIGHLGVPFKSILAIRERAERLLFRNSALETERQNLRAPAIRTPPMSITERQVWRSPVVRTYICHGSSPVAQDQRASMSASPDVHRKSGLSLPVESFGRRRRTKVPEERTRGPRALAMGI
jgi:hypothetical protein